KGLVLASVIGAAVVAGVLFRWNFLGGRFGKDTGTMAARLDYWRATAKMIADHPWLGVGSGNFGGYYPRYMAETAGEKIKDPHNFVLELWATGGVFVLLAVLTALGAFFVYVVRLLASGASQGSDTLRPAPEAGQDPRWEYYVGGVF